MTALDPAREQALGAVRAGVTPRKETTDMTKDPVCGMAVDETRAAAKAEYRGRTYYFCSAACKARFEKAPDQYVADRQGGGGGTG